MKIEFKNNDGAETYKLNELNSCRMYVCVSRWDKPCSIPVIVLPVSNGIHKTIGFFNPGGNITWLCSGTSNNYLFRDLKPDEQIIITG